MKRATMATDLHWSVNHETAEKQTTTEHNDCASAEYIKFNFKTLFLNHAQNEVQLSGLHCSHLTSIKVLRRLAT